MKLELHHMIPIAIGVGLISLMALDVHRIMTNQKQCSFVPALAKQHAYEYCAERGQEVEGFYQTRFGGCEWRCREV